MQKILLVEDDWKLNQNICYALKKEGYDVNAMYDVTRNIILGQGVLIPYPEKYWTAEVFLDGYANGSSAFMFSVEL